jgi:hypothetical protein
MPRKIQGYDEPCYKKCSSCHEVKSFDDFWKKTAGKDGLQGQCKDCKRVVNRNWELDNPEATRLKERRLRIKRMYGLTISEYEATLSAGCSICGKTEGKICMDHCHKTSLNRGPLCDSCNRAIGLFGDDPERLRSAADYIENWRSAHVS